MSGGREREIASVLYWETFYIGFSLVEMILVGLMDSIDERSCFYKGYILCVSWVRVSFLDISNKAVGCRKIK